MRTYEQLFIVDTAAAETDVDALLEQLNGIITASGGQIDKTDKWGVRKLAYRVKRQSEGFYILLAFSAGAEAVRELERRLRVADMVLKYITVRMDERMKRVVKRQKRREKRLARKPQLMAPAIPAAAPAVPAAPAPAVPGAPVEAPVEAVAETAAETTES